MRRYTEPDNLVRFTVSLNKYNPYVHIPCTIHQAVDQTASCRPGSSVEHPSDLPWHDCALAF